MIKFMRVICRLLGLGGDGPGEEEMEVQDGASDLTDSRNQQSSSQAMLSREEALDDDERTRRRAERRRAKKKRQKERKKLEREERVEDASEQEPEWDFSGAFVAPAACKIKLKATKSGATQISRGNKENEARSSQVESSEEMKRRGAALTLRGIQLFGQGQYSQAVKMFTEAICCDPGEHRFYGHRSYGYLCLKQYSTALMDAQRSIQLAPNWPLGYYHKGCALIGLKRYSEAEEAMQQVLILDQDCQEAASRLFACRLLQLIENPVLQLGYEEEQSKQLLENFTNSRAY